MVIAEHIAANFHAQFVNNKARVRELRRYATVGFATVFDLVPNLLNVNSSEVAGFVDDKRTPYGVRSCSLHAPLSNTCGSANGREPAVESLLLIGSSGSVGHTMSSDLDYWVCYNPARFSEIELDLFQRKLSCISKWALAEHGTEANFYLINTDELLKGKVTRLYHTETEGEVAPLLLLEEFYRTLLHVAGRMPIWLGIPVDADAGAYHRYSAELQQQEPCEYIDLGFPDLPSPQEVLAAALWLARKSEADPFKGIMKMMTLLDYTESDFTSKLLCNEVKEAVFNADEEDLPIDPYVLTINRVTEYGEARLAPEQLNLLRTAVVVKVLGSGTAESVLDLPEHSPKRKILHYWLKHWGWDHSRLVHLNNYSIWPEREKLNLGHDLFNMLLSVYTRIAHKLIRDYQGKVNPQDGDLIPFAARILSRQGGLEATVEQLPSYLQRKSLGNNMVLTYQDSKYCLYALDTPPTALTDDWLTPDNLIYSASRAARIAAWLVSNNLYSSAMLLQLFNIDRSILSLETLTGLLDLMTDLFPPPDFSAQDESTIWSSNSVGATLVLVNLELPLSFTDLGTIDFIYRTGWGEMRHHFIDLHDMTSAADKYLRVAQVILKESECEIDDMVLYNPPISEMSKVVMNLKGALAAMKRKRTPAPSSRRSQLDLY